MGVATHSKSPLNSAGDSYALVEDLRFAHFFAAFRIVLAHSHQWPVLR